MWGATIGCMVGGKVMVGGIETMLGALIMVFGMDSEGEEPSSWELNSLSSFSKSSSGTESGG